MILLILGDSYHVYARGFSSYDIDDVDKRTKIVNEEVEMTYQVNELFDVDCKEWKRQSIVTCCNVCRKCHKDAKK